MDEILNLINSVSEGFPSYFSVNSLRRFSLYLNIHGCRRGLVAGITDAIGN